MQSQTGPYLRAECNEEVIFAICCWCLFSSQSGAGAGCGPTLSKASLHHEAAAGLEAADLPRVAVGQHPTVLGFRKDLRANAWLLLMIVHPGSSYVRMFGR